MMIILIYDLSVYDATFYDGNHIRMAFFSFYFLFFLIKKKVRMPFIRELRKHVIRFIQMK
jgi:hypothetical protein